MHANASCLLCLDPMDGIQGPVTENMREEQQGFIVHNTECDHIFHLGCQRRWLALDKWKTLCPICGALWFFRTDIIFSCKYYKRLIFLARRGFHDEQLPQEFHQFISEKMIRCISVAAYVATTATNDNSTASVHPTARSNFNRQNIDVVLQCVVAMDGKDIVRVEDAKNLMSAVVLFAWKKRDPTYDPNSEVPDFIKEVMDNGFTLYAWLERFK
ncbi:hypothetical protein MBLNU230_g5537t1 [Neophaeotheca triangularis]